ncbi:MAG: biotin/lipoyl-containing protein [Methanomassiliicoccales archaeon]
MAPSGQKRGRERRGLDMVKIRIHLNGQVHEALVEKNGGDYRVTLGDNILVCTPKDGGVVVNKEFLALNFEGSLEEGAEIDLDGRKVMVKVEPIIEIERGESYSEEETGPSERKDETGSIVAPMPGKIVSIKVKPGDKVNTNQLLLILEAMKMENEILATEAGTVKEIKVKPGEMVEGGKTLMVIE